MSLIVTFFRSRPNALVHNIKEVLSDIIMSLDLYIGPFLRVWPPCGEYLQVFPHSIRGQRNDQEG